MAHVLRQELVVGGKELAFFRRELPLQMRGDDGPAGFPAQFPDLVEAVLMFGGGWKGERRRREVGGEGESEKMEALIYEEEQTLNDWTFR